MRAVFLAILLAGCVINHTPESTPILAPAQSCPAPSPIAAPPKPVWPDSCVADWYAKASLPPCVEAYLADLKKQQKTIAKKRAVHQ